MTYRWRRQREPSGAAALPPLVASVLAAGTASAGVTTGAIDTTGATILVLGIATSGSTTIPTISDSKSNVWTQLTPHVLAGPDTDQILYYAANPTVGTGHTFTSSAVVNSFTSLGVIAARGVRAVTPFDVQNGSSGTTSSLATGSITPSVSGALIVTAFGFAGGTNQTTTVDSGFTIVGTAAESPPYGLSMAYLVQSSAAAINPTWAQTGTNRNATSIAAFKP